MRHRKHKNQLGVKKEHRHALMANLAVALITHGRIQTTLKKAKALRPFAERLVTLAKKGGIANRRLAAARLRDEVAVKTLFDERVEEFRERNGGYTRIYKLGTRRGDAAEMAIIEWVGAGDTGHRGKKKGKRDSAKQAAPATDESVAEEGAEDKAKAAAVATEDEGAAEKAQGEEPAAEPKGQGDAPKEEGEKKE